LLHSRCIRCLLPSILLVGAPLATLPLPGLWRLCPLCCAAPMHGGQLLPGPTISLSPSLAVSSVLWLDASPHTAPSVFQKFSLRPLP
jgi:hypothetical protein